MNRSDTRVVPMHGGRGGVSGFTLIELVIVMSVLSILAAIAMPRYKESTIRASAAELRSRLGTIELGYAQFRVDRGLSAPAPGQSGVQVSDLEAWVEPGLFQTPYAITMGLATMSAAPWGVAGRTEVIILTGVGARASEILEALKDANPSKVQMPGRGIAVFPLDVSGSVPPTGGTAPTGTGTPPSATGTPPAATGNPVAGTGTPQTGTGTQPSGGTGASSTGTQPGGGTSPAGGGGASPTGTQSGTGPAPGSSGGPPSQCLAGSLPPGQLKQCLAGNTNSNWFRHSNH